MACAWPGTQTHPRGLPVWPQSTNFGAAEASCLLFHFHSLVLFSLPDFYLLICFPVRYHLFIRLIQPCQRPSSMARVSRSRSCYYTISSYGRATYNSKRDYGKTIIFDCVLMFLLFDSVLFSRVATVLLYKKATLT